MRTRRLCFGLIVAATVGAACASSASISTPGVESGKAAPTPAAAASAGGFGGLANPTLGPGSQSGEAITTAAPSGPGSNAASPENQVIKTGSVSIQVAAVDDSIAQATAQIHTLGGWLAGSDRTASTAEDYASATYRVPVSRFEDALAAMRKLGTKVLSEHTESTPVGGQIVDLQARIANLRASEAAIQAIMTKANTIGDVLTVQQRLADVQGQIEQLLGQLAALSDQSAYSTLTVIFIVPALLTASASPTPSPSPTATPIPWNAGDQAGQAAGTLGEVGQGAATFLIWFAILVLPLAVVSILLLALLGRVARLLEPYRRRLLPSTVPQPVTWAQPGWPVPGQPVPDASGSHPQDVPKA